MRARDPAILKACLRPSARDLPGRVARGAVWMTLLVVLRTVLTIASTAVLARLLTPADYGLVAMSTVVTEMAALLGFFGMTPLIVQRRRLTRLDLDSAFWISVALGFGVAAIVVATSFPAASFFREPRIAPILWAVSVQFVLEDLSIIHHSIANRLLLFKLEFVSQFANLLVRIGVSIALAAAGFGVWSLVWGAIAGRVAQFVIIWYVIPYVPRWRYNAEFLRANWRAGGSYFGSGVIMYVLGSLDTAVVGRTFGPTQLGYYQTAFALPEEMRSRLSFSMQKVVFPAYALLQADQSAFRNGVLRSIRILSAIILPMGVGMAVLADPIVAVLYGSQWAPVVPILRIAAAVGVLRAMQGLVSNVYFAKGRPQINLKVNLALLPLAVIAVLVGSLWGTLGVATGLLLVSAVSLATTRIALRLVGVRSRDALAAALPATAASMVMGAGVWLVNAFVIPGSAGPVSALVASVCIGVGLFGAALVLLAPATARELWSMLRHLRSQPA